MKEKIIITNQNLHFLTKTNFTIETLVAHIKFYCMETYKELHFFSFNTH